MINTQFYTKYRPRVFCVLDIAFEGHRRYILPFLSPSQPVLRVFAKNLVGLGFL